MATVTARRGETVDQLCYRVTGSTAGVTEAVLRDNPGLADLGLTLPEGTQVTIPDALPPQRVETVQLWT